MPKWEVPDSTPPLNKKGKPEVRKFKWDMVFRDGREWSFEECRARDQGVLGKNPWDGMGELSFPSASVEIVQTTN
jgi:checkpoint serine/threonine-protein kinase